MKRISTLIFTVVLCIFIFSSCDIFKHEHVIGDWKYNGEYHWRITTCPHNKCDIDSLLEDHVDENKNDICDLCGSVHEHIFGEWQFDETYHWCSAKCTWNGCDFNTVSEHFDRNGNSVCDVCGYIIGDGLELSVNNLVYEFIDYNGGYTETYIFDFNDNTLKYRGYLPYEGEEPEFETVKAFSDEEEEILIQKLRTYGLFDIDANYPSPEGVMDGGGWNMTVEYSNGSIMTSHGSNNSPGTVFSNCAKVFYDLCQRGIVGYVPTEYYCPPDVSYSVNLGNSSHGYDGFSKRLGYSWNGFESVGGELYSVNQAFNFPHDFYEGNEYSLTIYTANYNTFNDYPEFTKCTIKSFDYNESLTNESSIYESGWFNQIEIDLELDKIYLIRLEFENGDFVEYTFNTSVAKN